VDHRILRHRAGVVDRSFRRQSTGSAGAPAAVAQDPLPLQRFARG